MSSEFARDIAILLFGLVIALVGGSVLDPPSGWLKTIGIGLIGYGIIEILKLGFGMGRSLFSGVLTSRLFKYSVAEKGAGSPLPLLIATDIEGCITPANRAEIDLRRFQRLRAYCEFQRKNPAYPQLVIFTGRSQGYAEFVAQALGIVNAPVDIPFVIENGAALYYPKKKKTVSLLSVEQIAKLHQVHKTLSGELPKNEFEPKTYMVTVNPRVPGEIINELRDKVNECLRLNELNQHVLVTSTASAVDVTPKGISKFTGVEAVVRALPGEIQTDALQRIVAIGDSISDEGIIKNVGSGYCPAENVSNELRNIVATKFGHDHVINARDVDFVVQVVERECNLVIK